MVNRRFQFLLLLLLAAAAGCQGDRELQQELLNLKNESTLQLELLERHSAFLTEKTDMVQKQVDALVDTDRRLSHDVAIYTARPDQIRREILDEVNTRGELAAERREQFGEEIQQRLDDKARELATKAQETVDQYQAVLDRERAFINYVFSQQDSMNRVFANRFADRPWYESILGTWNDRQHATP